MDSTIFHDSILSISLRSPFARRVRLAFWENKIPFTEKVYDVFQSNPALTAVNPLSRVPALQLKSGEVLIDSNLILQAFYETGDRPLTPKKREERLQVYYWSALANGLCELLVRNYINNTLPEEKRDSQFESELASGLAGTLSLLVKKVESKVLVGDSLTQADLDIGTSLAYTNLRYSEEWQKGFPTVAAYLQNLEKRPSFQKTLPPA
jgi:glutathione S-transferase